MANPQNMVLKISIILEIHLALKIISSLPENNNMIFINSFGIQCIFIYYKNVNNQNNNRLTNIHSLGFTKN
jgi:hypothetical protein